MPRGKPSPKLAITVDADVHDRVLEAAANEGVSVSAWMTRAARRALLARDGLAAIAEWEAQHGPLTEAEMVAARQRVASQVGATSARPRNRSA
jgi:negative regulator of sigma E activity